MGVGLASTVSPMYIAEIAPARLRGRLVVVNQLAIVIGLSMSVFVTYWLSFGGHWRWMFATQGLPVLCLIVGLLLVPESPRWLAAAPGRSQCPGGPGQDQRPAQARTRTAGHPGGVGRGGGRVGELFRPGIRLALAHRHSLDGLFADQRREHDPALHPHAVPGGRHHRRPDAILNSVYIDGWITLCTVVAFWLTRSFGRRSILIAGTIAMAAGHVLMFLNFTYHLPRLLTLAAMFVPTGAFTLTLAPLSWVVFSEIFPNRVRGRAMSIATCAMFASSYVTVNLFPMVLD